MKISSIKMTKGIDYGITTSHTANIIIDNDFNVTAIIEKYKYDDELEFIEVLENNDNIPIEIIERLINDY